jgi:hypothetical protein
VSFIRENLLVEFVGFPGDVYYEHGQIKFRDDVTVSIQEGFFFSPPGKK